MKINNLIFILIPILFLGCIGVKPDMEFYSIDIESSNKMLYFKHFSILAPIIKDESEASKWHFIASENIHSFNMGLNKNNNQKDVRWLKYHLEIRTYSAENEKGRDKKLQYYLKALEAIKNRDEQYLKEEYLDWITWKKRGIISAKYENVNKYPAIVADTHTKYRDTDKYSREYFFLTYSKTGKLKAYIITISVDIDKADADDPELLVHYSFEDMLKRSQRSLDSFVASDEDFPKDAPRYQ